MSRVPEYSVESLNEEQKAAYQEVFASRGSMPAPNRIWTLRPELGHHAGALGWYFPNKALIPARLVEMVVVMLGNHWRLQHMVKMHAPKALAAGLSESVVSALKELREPEFVNEDEKVVYAVVKQITEKKVLEQALYDRAVALFGQEGVVDLAGAIGYYSVTATTLAFFDIGEKIETK